MLRRAALLLMRPPPGMGEATVVGKIYKGSEADFENLVGTLNMSNESQADRAERERKERLEIQEEKAKDKLARWNEARRRQSTFYGLKQGKIRASQVEKSDFLRNASEDMLSQVGPSVGSGVGSGAMTREQLEKKSERQAREGHHLSKTQSRFVKKVSKHDDDEFDF
eukprot:TRINITY_DN2067_c1_g1_i1.p1 TRINITY_DN2067_c1_g1~~TRINITY_DN2067_c1_g1_i1.p1  ORF type:complete len:186 (+),score=39.95 TRINITY_DN2067_c1_g1_i1:59-559(+)